MAVTLKAKLEKAIKSVRIIENREGSAVARGGGQGICATVRAETFDQAQQRALGELEAQKQTFVEASEIFKKLIAEIDERCRTVLSEHREEIAKLSVEIARKVLAQKIRQGDYEIEAIIKEALKNAPTGEDVTVRANPEDLGLLQRAQQQAGQGDGLAGIKLVADVNVGRAECVLESSRGIVESFVDKHLEQIVRALQKVEQV
jgi:flagellar biosynthesis/type III secretory pathway protein FliH